MERHQQQAINVFLERYGKDEHLLAVLLGGSLAHGFARPDSDIDLMLIVTPEEYNRRRDKGTLAFSVWDICTYEHGYVDCKVADKSFLEKVAEKGSDPARYAFQDNRILLSRLDGLEDLLSRICRFPEEKQEHRRIRFASQLLAWKWYYGEGVKKGNLYLQNLAVQKIVLFSVRTVLNENKLLYPYHKWMFRVLENAGDKPEGLGTDIDTLLREPSVPALNNLVGKMLSFIGFTEKSVDWPNVFLRDSEQNWLDHDPPVDDL